MEYRIITTSQFRKQLKLMKRRNCDVGRLEFVVNMLAKGKSLEIRYHEHKLSGNYRDCWECHIEPDWLLIYRKDAQKLILLLVETGSHSDLFGK